MPTSDELKNTEEEAIMNFQEPNYQELYEEALVEIENLNSTISMIRKLLMDNDVVISDKTTTFEKSPYQMTKEELFEANKIVTQRLKPKATATDRAAMPNEDEKEKLYTDECHTLEGGGDQVIARIALSILKDEESGDTVG